MKGNQPALRRAVHAAFDRACEADFAGAGHDRHESSEGGHGRHEGRSVTVLYDPAGLPPKCRDVAAVVPGGREREAGGVILPRESGQRESGVDSN